MGKSSSAKEKLLPVDPITAQATEAAGFEKPAVEPISGAIMKPAPAQVIQPAPTTQIGPRKPGTQVGPRRKPGTPKFHKGLLVED